MKNLEKISKKPAKIARRIALSAVGLLAMLQTSSCGRVFENATLNVNLPEGPYSYSIQIRNKIVSDMNNPEASDMWISWGETEGSFELNPFQSYLLQAIGFNVNLSDEGGLEFLRYYSKEVYSVTLGSGETGSIDFTMPKEPVIIRFE